MPYEYRKMTSAEREQVVQQRRAAGCPFHSPPHRHREAGYYLLTAANYGHMHIMASPSRSTQFEVRLLEAMHSAAAEVFGWVVLPNHYHVLVSVESLDHISAVLKQLHGSTSREWNLEDQLVGQRRVWYYFADRAIRDDRQFSMALNYIHVNPLKHGYIEDLYQWPWSSVHNYCETYGREWLRERWKSYPPGDFGKGWDEESD